MNVPEDDGGVRGGRQQQRWEFLVECTIPDPMRMPSQFHRRLLWISAALGQAMGQEGGRDGPVVPDANHAIISTSGDPMLTSVDAPERHVVAVTHRPLHLHLTQIPHLSHPVKPQSIRNAPRPGSLDHW